MLCPSIIMSLVLSNPVGDTSFEQIVLPEPMSVDWAGFGARVALGDTEGDGDVDLAVSMPNTLGVGGVWILHGPDYAGATKVVVPPEVGYGAGFGIYSLLLADLNHDGKSDLITHDLDILATKGRNWVHWAPAFATYVKVMPPHQYAGIGFGELAAVGDVDNDGLTDLVMGASNIPPNGALYVYRATTGFDAPAKVLKPATSAAFQVEWGEGVCIGDSDGDGLADILTNQVTAGSLDEQMAWIPSLTPSNATILHIPAMNPACPVSYHAKMLYRDVNNDGKKDIVVRGLFAYNPANGQLINDDGSILIDYGPNFTTGKCIQQAVPQNGSAFGVSFDLGDVNRDGFVDIVGAAPSYHLSVFDPYSTTSKDGRVTIVYGPDFVTNQSFDAEVPGVYFGNDVAVGDADKDGFDDVFIGVPGADVVVLLQHRSLRALGPSSVSVTSGGSVSLSLECGKLSANESYLVLSSFSGSSPGLDVPAGGKMLHVPLNFDALTQIGLSFANTPYFAQFLGQLGVEGNAVSQFTIPAGALPPSLVGTKFTFAGLTFAGGQPIRYVTNPVDVALTP